MLQVLRELKQIVAPAAAPGATLASTQFGWHSCMLESSFRQVLNLAGYEGYDDMPDEPSEAHSEAPVPELSASANPVPSCPEEPAPSAPSPTENNEPPVKDSLCSGCG